MQCLTKCLSHCYLFVLLTHAMVQELRDQVNEDNINCVVCLCLCLSMHFCSHFMMLKVPQYNKFDKVYRHSGRVYYLF